MPKLTKRLIAALQPRAGAYIVFDADIPTFGCRVYPSGQKSYVLSYRAVPGRRGSKKTYVLGACALLTPDQARSLAREWLLAIRTGADPAAEKAALRTAPTVADLAARYLQEHAEVKKKPGSVRMDRTNLRLHVLPTLGARLVQELSPATTSPGCITPCGPRPAPPIGCWPCSRRCARWRNSGAGGPCTAIPWRISDATASARWKSF